MQTEFLGFVLRSNSGQVSHPTPATSRASYGRFTFPCVVKVCKRPFWATTRCRSYPPRCLRHYLQPTTGRIAMGRVSCAALSSVVVLLAGATQVSRAHPPATTLCRSSFVAPTLVDGPLARSLRLRTSGACALKCQGERCWQYQSPGCCERALRVFAQEDLARRATYVVGVGCKSSPKVGFGTCEMTWRR